MRLLRDEVYRLIAKAKGEVPASAEEQASARKLYKEILDHLTDDLHRQAPGDLSITHESVRDSIERAYREYRERRKRRGLR